MWSGVVGTCVGRVLGLVRTLVLPSQGLSLGGMRRRRLSLGGSSSIGGVSRSPSEKLSRPRTGVPQRRSGKPLWGRPMRPQKPRPRSKSSACYSDAGFDSDEVVDATTWRFGGGGVLRDACGVAGRSVALGSLLGGLCPHCEVTSGARLGARRRRCAQRRFAQLLHYTRPLVVALRRPTRAAREIPRPPRRRRGLGRGRSQPASCSRGDAGGSRFWGSRA